MDAARIAYEAYSHTTDNKNFQGNEMPKFDDLPPKIQEAWANAAHAAGLHAMSELDKILRRPDGTPMSLAEARIGTNG